MLEFKVVIPARYASQRLPGKPLLSIAGKPMIQHVHESAIASGASEVIVATDDSRISQAVEQFNGRVCMTLPTHRSGSDRISEVAQQLGWTDSDIVVNLQGDEPMMPPGNIRQVAAGLAEHPDVEMSSLCVPLADREALYDHNVVKVVRDSRDYALYFSRATIPWGGTGRDVFRHIGLYAYRVGYLHAFTALDPAPLEITERLEQLRALWHGASIHVAEATESPGPGVDTEEDYQKVDAIVRQQKARG